MKRLHKIILAIISGVCLGFGWPETGGITPLLFLGFIPLLLLQDDAQKNDTRLFGYNYLAFVVWHCISVYWVYCVNEGMPTKVISFIMPVGVNPLFMATVMHWFHLARKKTGDKNGYVAFFSMWIAFEYLHLNWDLSYPWLNLGNALCNSIEWIQWYEYTGAFGGTLWILLVNLFLFHVLNGYLKKDTRKIIRNGATVVLIIAVPSIISWSMFTNYQENGSEVEIVVVQPNIDPYFEKFSGLTTMQQVQKMLSLAEKECTENTAYVLGPETSIPSSIAIHQLEEVPVYEYIKAFVSKYPKVSVVTGASLIEIYEDNKNLPITARKFRNADVWYDSYNSGIQIDTSEQVQIYHKSKLVLGVEKMPFPRFFKQFQDVIFDLGGTTGTLGVQEERAVFVSTEQKKVAPVICWESVYGEYANEYVKNGAQAIFILTNDGWWDDSPGYKQHFDYAKLRAIETRKSIARSANTGISGFINQKGETLETTGWWVETALRGKIKFNDEITFYVKHGNYIARLASFIAVLMLLWTFVKRFSKEELSLK